MKEVLFVYPQMMMGGSTTSLLSILNNIDKTKYNIDLLLLHNGGPLYNKIPLQVNVLPFAHRYQNKAKRIIRRLCSPKYMFYYLISRIISIRDKNIRHGWQYLEKHDVDFYRAIDKEYDCAIGFLEGECNSFVDKHVEAKKKIAWMHLNYIEAGFTPKYDKYLLNFDNIVCVSNSCSSALINLFPELRKKVVVIENILSNEYIRKLASEVPNDLPEVDSRKINFVTTCRIDFQSKGLNRVIEIINKNEKIWDSFVWYIIGNGPDYDKLVELIKMNKLDDKIILLGNKINPLSYEKNMDVFFLPSYFEGKPMAVTEAMMLGLPALVTNYSSAGEQIKDGFDGIIVENTNKGIFSGLQKLLFDKSMINKLKENVINSDYSNVEEMKKFYSLIEKENI